MMMTTDRKLGFFSNLQKFSSITDPEAVVQEFSNEEEVYDFENVINNVTMTFQVKTEITSFGDRKIKFLKDVEKRVQGSSYVHSGTTISGTTSLRALAEAVERLNYGSHSTPKQYWYVPPEERQAVHDLTSRICELYKVTDQQIAESPFYTRVYCKLTENSLFPEYRLRQRLEKGEYRRPLL